MSVEIHLSHDCIAWVDDVDTDLTSFCWYLNRYRDQGTKSLIVRKVKGKKHILSRIIMERVLGRSLTASEQVDHRDGDRCNNRRGNLRLAIGAQNSFNKGMYKTNKSGYKGIRLKNSGYEAQISYGGKVRSLGVYSTPEEAARAYNDAATLHHGEFARLNEIPDDNGARSKR